MRFPDLYLCISLQLWFVACKYVHKISNIWMYYTYMGFTIELSVWKLCYLESFNFLKGLCTMQCTSKHKLQMQLSIYDATQWNQNFYKFLYVDREGILHKYFCHIIGCSLSKGWSVWNPTYIKFMFSKKATKIDKIFTFNLTLCSKC